MSSNRKDVTGQKFGRLTAILRVGTIKKNGKSISIWLWRCDCGNEKEIPLKNVATGNTKGCGCLHKGLLADKGKDISGQRFGYLTAIKKLRRNKHQQWIWELICDCGGRTESNLGNLTSGCRKSCGCGISVKGARAYNWTGGRKLDSAGYVYLYSPDHPNSPNTRRSYIAEHRLVMEKMLGRYLLKSEEVHHKNGIKDDNRPENLELWVRSHPRGARASDLVEFAREILAKYSDLFPE